MGSVARRTPRPCFLTKVSDNQVLLKVLRGQTAERVLGPQILSPTHPGKVAGQLHVAGAGGSVVTAEVGVAGLAAPLGRNHKKKEKCWVVGQGVGVGKRGERKQLH